MNNQHHHQNNNNHNPTVLNVAEKPSVARSLAAVFARMDGAQDRGMQRRGEAGSNQVFTHENVRFPSVFAQGHGQAVQGPISPHKMITASVRGHLASQDFPHNYGWSKCDPGQLFDAPIETTYRDDVMPLERQLRQLSVQCTVLVLWLDCDREGEAIGDEVRSVCLQANPRLHVYRAKFSTVMAQEIQRALQTLGRVNEHFVHAVQARSELDLRVGAAFTRFQTLRLQRKFDGFSEQGVVSYGPCQFPTLGFVVERWARIETFRTELFWFLELSIRVDAPAAGNNSGNNTSSTANSIRPIYFTWKRNRLYDQTLTMVLYESCLDAGEAVVTSLTGRPKNKWRPVPLATVELQKRASRYLRIGSETLMAAAEQLYQQGYISYPRTETEKFRPEFQHRPLIEQLANVNGGDFSQYASRLLTDNRFQMPRAGQHDDNAHPPITPCKAVDPSTINDETQRKIYSLIVKHYLACCSRDAVGKETQLTVRVGSEDFTARGLMILEKNWLEIYHPWERWSTGQGELPPLQVGSHIVPTSLLMKEGTTTAPEPLSEVELISLMDRNGIGTDATIAQHISTIQDREYATKNANQKFTPTKLGIALVEGYNSMGYQLNKPDLRRETEAECNNIAAGRKTKDEVVARLLAKMRQCYQVATQEAQKLDVAVARHFSRIGSSDDTTQVVQARFSECGACNNMMALKQERNARGGNGRNNNNNGDGVRRKMLYCGTCRSGWNLPRGQAVPKTENDDNGGGPAVKCPICQFQVIRILRGEGYEGNGYHVCPKCFSDPPVEHGGTLNGGEFRCFACRHPQCSLAGGTPGGDVEVFACPFCHPATGRASNDSASSSKVCLRKNSRGFVLSCNKYAPGQDRCPYTIWLPKESQTVAVPSGDENNQDSVCPRCSTGARPVRKVTFVWKAGSVPPYMDRECTTCILCDDGLRREMSISLPRADQVQIRRTAPAAGRSGGTARGGGGGRGGAGRGGGRGRGRGRGGGGGGRHDNNGAAGGGGTNSGTCFKCSQPGHWANNCPNG